MQCITGKGAANSLAGPAEAAVAMDGVGGAASAAAGGHLLAVLLQPSSAVQ